MKSTILALILLALSGVGIANETTATETLTLEFISANPETRSEVVYPKVNSCTMTPSYLCPSKTKFNAKTNPARVFKSGKVFFRPGSGHTAVEGRDYIWWRGPANECRFSGGVCKFHIGIKFVRGCQSGDGTKEIRLVPTGSSNLKWSLANVSCGGFGNCGLNDDSTRNFQYDKDNVNLAGMFALNIRDDC